MLQSEKAYQMFPTPYVASDPLPEAAPRTSLLLTITSWIMFHITETTRLAISIFISMIIYLLFSWFPNFVAFLITTVLLCGLGQFEIQITRRKLQ